MATIHPYKGYLNTKFHLYAKGTIDVDYKISPIGDENNSQLVVGSFSPNTPHSIKLQHPGAYIIEFSDGTSSEINVEDGYKFGGSSYKTSFIFDETPWCFIIMNDRTYFYNRDTDESYVESISPDSIEKISCDFVILKNKNHEEITLYSLIEQKPILCFSDMICSTDDTIVWKDDECLFVYSLTQQKIVHRIETSIYTFDSDKNRLIFSKSNDILLCELSKGYDISKVFTPKGRLVTFVNNTTLLCLSHGANGSSVRIYKLDNLSYEKEIPVKGNIARINNVDLISIDSRRRAIYQFDLENSEFPEASIEVNFSEFIFYPCSWDVFYVQRDTKLSKTTSHFNRKEEIHLKSTETELNQVLNRFENNIILNDSRFVLYNESESFIRSQQYNAAGYINGDKILVHRNIVIRISDNYVFTLSKNGYWDNRMECDYDFSEFEKYGIVKDNKTGIYKSFYYDIKGKDYNTNSNPIHHIELGDSIILEGGKIFFKKSDLHKFSVKPFTVSPDLTQGIIIENGKVYFLDISSKMESKKHILSDIFDESKYRDVILGDDGNQILYRDSEATRVTDIITGENLDFGNLSYVRQVNGMRPHFQRSGALQPRIVNPVTGQMLDADQMKQYNFISPDGTLYADTRLKEYVEYYWLTDNKSLSYDEYHKLLNIYSYPWQEKHDSPAWKKVVESRRRFVQEHFDYLNEKFPHLFHNDPTGKNWMKSVLDEDNTFGAIHFLERIIGKKGIAYIRRTTDDSVFAKIELGEPLTYINYVAFSYDSHYMALAGYRGDRSSSWGGLFLIYNLANKTVIAYQNTGRAVWLTAFSKLNALASYTSNPFTFFAQDADEYVFDDFKSKLINGKSFLTFSPNGRYFALSEQGYISKYDRSGEINIEWGHQPSSLVEIRSIGNPDKYIIKYHDLSDEGIADVATHATNVAAVSFSNDNKRLMMVGKDGVVIIRNLHLNDHALK